MNTQDRFTVFASLSDGRWLIWDRKAGATGTDGDPLTGDFVRVDGVAKSYPTRGDAETIAKELNDVENNVPSTFDECSACGAMVRIIDFSFHLEFECTGEPFAANAGSTD